MSGIAAGIATFKPLDPMSTIVISSGHGKYVRGASGLIDEVDEARKVVDQLASVLKQRGVSVLTFHDNTSTDQSTNLETIVNYHNSKTRNLDISCHFNAYVETTKPMGCEVLYVTQLELAERVSAAIASVGFTDRGPKYRDDLYFLNQTEMPAILLEICFVDSQADCGILPLSVPRHRGGDSKCPTRRTLHRRNRPCISRPPEACACS